MNNHNDTERVMHSKYMFLDNSHILDRILFENMETSAQYKKVNFPFCKNTMYLIFYRSKISEVDSSIRHLVLGTLVPLSILVMLYQQRQNSEAMKK